MVEVLKLHRARQLEERMKDFSWEDPGLVFPNTKGKIRRRESAVRSFKRFLEEVGIPTDVRFHDLRHLALRQGMPLQAVSKMLGHSDPAMTSGATLTCSRIGRRVRPGDGPPLLGYGTTTEEKNAGEAAVQ